MYMQHIYTWRFTHTLFDIEMSRMYSSAQVVLSIYKDSLGTRREATMKWVVELLYPTLLQVSLSLSLSLSLSFSLSHARSLTV